MIFYGFQSIVFLWVLKLRLPRLWSVTASSGRLLSLCGMTLVTTESSLARVIKCSRFILYISHPKCEIIQFPQKSWYLLVGNSISKITIWLLGLFFATGFIIFARSFEVFIGNFQLQCRLQYFYFGSCTLYVLSSTLTIMVPKDMRDDEIKSYHLLSLSQNSRAIVSKQQNYHPNTKGVLNVLVICSHHSCIVIYSCTISTLSEDTVRT